MKIRAITIGHKIPYLSDDKILENSLETHLRSFYNLNTELIERFGNIDIEVQTKRLSSQPLLSYDQQLYEKNLNEIILRFHNQLGIVERLLSKYEIDYYSSCTVLADSQMEKYGIYEKLLLNEVPQFIKKRENFFSSLHVASTENGINLSALKSGAKIVKDLSDPDPFDNLKFCISTNVSPDTPFFPAAYHLSERPSFGLALEMVDEVIEVFQNSTTLDHAQNNLKKRFNEIYDSLLDIGESIGKKYEIEFDGIDLSIAPYPTLDKSIGTAFEQLGFEYFGAPGSLLAVALIKNAIPKRKKIIGFSGLMPSVLEDYTIAKGVSDNNFNLDTLLLFSTMCGTGLDCIPLPGDVTEKELFYILLDLCTISIRLNKPLTARLMPIPGRAAGDDIEFDFEYFAPSKILDIKRLKDTKKVDIFSQKEKQFNFISH